MTAFLERYRRAAEERYLRLDAVLDAMPDHPSVRTDPIGDPT